MTNEAIAKDIQTSKDKDLTALLWERVKGICFKLALEYYSNYAERFSSCGVTVEDVKQECYFAFLQAVNSYDPNSRLKFTSYLNYPILNICRELLGIRNKEGVNHSPLDNYSSLDIPIADNEGNEHSPLDYVEDEAAFESYETAIQSISDEQTRKVLTKALNRLEKPLRAVIVQYYFDNKTLPQIAEYQHTSVEMVRKQKVKALNHLRKSPEVRILWAERHVENYLHSHIKQYTCADYLREQTASKVIKRGSLLSENQRERLYNSFV